MVSILPDNKSTFRFLKFVLVVAFMATIVFGVYVSVAGSVTVTSSIDPAKVSSTSPLPDGATLTGTKLEISESHLSADSVRIMKIYAGATVAVALIIKVLLIQILDDIMKGDIFIKANVRRVKTLAVIMFLSFFEPFIHSIVLEAVIAQSNLDISSGWDLNLDFVPILEAFAIFAIAEVFAAGIKLRERTESVVLPTV